MMGHNERLSKFKKIEIISRQHCEIGSQLSEKKTEKHTNTWRLKNLLLNNQQITKGIKEKIKKYLETNENKTQ